MFDNNSINVASLLDEEQILAFVDYENDLRTCMGIKSPIMRLAALKKVCDKYRSILGFTFQEIQAHIPLLEMQDVQEEEDEEEAPLTLKDILAMQASATDWVVPHLIADGGGLSLVAAAPKTGKTLIFIYQLAYSIAVTGNFLGLPCKRGKVLIFECEEPAAKVARTMRNKGVSKHNKDIEGLLDIDPIIVVRDFDISTDIKKLKQLVKEHQPDLVIFDSLRAITKTLTVSENSADMSKYLYVLQRTLNYLKVPGIVIHHMSKNGKERGIEGVAGSLSLAGATDMVIMLYRDENSDKHVVELATIPREGIPVRWMIERQKPRSGYWEYQVVEDRGIPPEQVRLERKILAFLSKSPNKVFTRKDLAEGLQIADNSVFYTAVDRLVDGLQIVEDQMDSGVFGVWIGENSTWAGFSQSGASGGLDDFGKADLLSKCQSKSEMDSLTTSWSDVDKAKIWKLLSEEEREHVIRIQHPCKFAVGNWVKDSNEELHKITETKFDAKNKYWIYVVEGDREFAESELAISLDYVDANYEENF